MSLFKASLFIVVHKRTDSQLREDNAKKEDLADMVHQVVFGRRNPTLQQSSAT